MLSRAQPGDLLFRYQGESGFSRAVSTVVRGWGGLTIDHVGIYEGGGWVWEASHEGVRRSSLTSWVGGLLLGQLKTQTRTRRPSLAGDILAWVKKQEGLPYNDAFDQGKTSYYCSELIIDAFRHAGYPVFRETPLTFLDPETGRPLPYWEQYYRDRGRPIPEGQPGSHPAHLSLSEELTIHVLRPAESRSSQKGKTALR